MTPGVPPPLPPLPSSHATNTQWDSSLRPVALLAGIVLIVAVLVYRFAIPPLAGLAADAVPEAAVDAIGRLSLSALEQQFEESALPPARREEIIAGFSRLRRPDGARSDYEILFRRSEAIGANAMALPSGTIVVTDGLVEISGGTDEVIAVLAHEAGHVEHRHGLRLVFQSSFAAAGLSWLGDVSAVAAQVSSTLLEAKYSRDFEREADEYAVRLLDENGISREHLARMLERLEEAASARGSEGGGALMAYLSSHPVTSERLEAIRRSM